MIHHLKIGPKYYSDIKEGYKTFEIRFNDRDFKEGDVLQLQEFENNNYLYISINLEVY